MMNRILRCKSPLLAGLSFLLAVAAAFGADSPPVADIDNFIMEGMAQWRAPGVAIGIVHKGNVILTKGYGVRETGKPEAVDANTLFAIGSTTKAFTATALGLLVDRHKLEWNSRVSELWPDFQLADSWVTREIRVSDLLANRSGLSALSEGLWYGTDLTRDEIIHRLKEVPFEDSFRYTFQYRNVMFLAAGELIPRVDGRSWEKFIQEEFFNPLGMARSFPTEEGIDKLENIAHPHVIDYKGQAISIAYRPMNNIAPAGSIVSCVADMTQWLKLQLGSETYGVNKLITPETLTFIHQSQTPFPADGLSKEKPVPPAELRSYSLGWVTESYKGQRIVWHNGGIDGMSAWVGLIPEEQFGVVILTNLDNCDLRRAIFYRLVDTLIAKNAETTGAPPTAPGDLRPPLLETFRKAIASRDEAEESWQKWHEKPSPTEIPIEAYTGRYHHPALGDVEISKNSDGSLSFKKTTLLTLDLASLGKDRFLAKYRSHSDDLRNGKVNLEFTVKDGKATALTEDGLVLYKRVP